MADAMKGVTKAMMRMNKQLNLPEIQKIMMQFTKESEMMDMKEETMGDAVDDALGDAEDDEESDVIVNQVMDEIGIKLGEGMTSTPAAGRVPASADARAEARPAAADGAAGDDGDADLMARLNNLRRVD